jgi:hypothetical protein
MASENQSDLEAALHSVVDDTIEHIKATTESVEQLNSARIHQLTTLRRASIRSRSWFLIGAVVGFVAAVELIYKAVQNIREHGGGLQTVVFMLTAIASGTLAIFFLRRCIELHREIQTPMLHDPTTPPDFSTLSDGSQHWKNLEEMQ